MKILMMRFSSIGDIVLTSPVVRCLKKQLNAEIHFVAKRNFQDVIKNNPYIDRRFLIEENTNDTINQLKNEKYDYIIDLQKNFRSYKFKTALGVKSFTFDKLNIRKWLMVNFKMNVLPDVHIVDRYFESVRSLNVVNDGEGLDYFITPDDEKVINELPFASNEYIGWVIGAKHNTKRLPPEKMISIGRRFGSNVILLGGPEDFERGENIIRETGKNFYNACGKYPLNQSAAIVKHALKIITHDTGLMHIAAAFRKEIISVWGNTIPAFGMYPYFGRNKNASVILEVKNLSCRPCSKIGFEKCPRGHFKCMKEIDETVFEKL